MSTYISYLGPAGSNSYLACREIFNPINEEHDYLFLSQESIQKAIQSLNEDVSRLAVVPAFSSSEGIVKTTIDALVNDQYGIYKSGKRIIGSIKIPILFTLLRKKASLIPLREIQSIRIALQQCEEILQEEYFNTKVVPIESTSKAAQNASKDEEIGAIAPEICADLYDLQIMKRDLQGKEPNYTNFYILGIPKPYYFPSSRSLIIIRGSVRNLKIFLNILLDYGFNIYEIYSKIEKPKDWLYNYFFEIDGHEEEIRYKHLEMALNQYKINWMKLGCYPSSLQDLQNYLRRYRLTNEKTTTKIKVIEETGIENYKIYSHKPVITVQDVMDHLLILPQSIVKTIIYKTDIGFIFMSVPGNKEVDKNKLINVLGFVPEMAKKKDITTLGLEVGAISPLSGVEHPQIIDRRILDVEKIYCGFKNNSLSIRLNSKEIVEKIPNLKICDIAND